MGSHLSDHSGAADIIRSFAGEAEYAQVRLDFGRQASMHGGGAMERRSVPPPVRSIGFRTFVSDSAGIGLARLRRRTKTP